VWAYSGVWKLLLGHLERGADLDNADLGDGVVNIGGVAGIYTVVGVHGGNAGTGGLGVSAKYIAHDADYPDALGDADIRRPLGRRTVDHDDGTDFPAHRGVAGLRPDLVLRGHADQRGTGADYAAVWNLAVRGEGDSAADSVWC